MSFNICRGTLGSLAMLAAIRCASVMRRSLSADGHYRIVCRKLPTRNGSLCCERCRSTLGTAPCDDGHLVVIAFGRTPSGATRALHNPYSRRAGWPHWPGWPSRPRIALRSGVALWSWAVLTTCGQSEQQSYKKQCFDLHVGIPGKPRVMPSAGECDHSSAVHYLPASTGGLRRAQ